MNRAFKVFMFAAMVGAVLLAAGVYAAWLWVLKMDHALTTAWAILATFLLPVALYIGHWFGRTEVRGFLGGMDRGLDRVGRLVDMRDNSKINIHNKTHQPAIQPPVVVLPPEYPQISHRVSGQNDVVDL